MKLGIFALAVLFLTTSLQAQEPARRVIGKAPDTFAPGAPALEENYTVTVRGGFAEANSINVVLSGNGPKFSTQLADPSRKVELLLTPSKDALLVHYAINIQVPVKTESVGQVYYSDASVNGNYLAKLGEAFPVLKVGDTTLTIQVDKTAK